MPGRSGGRPGQGWIVLWVRKLLYKFAVLINVCGDDDDDDDAGDAYGWATESVVVTILIV